MDCSLPGSSVQSLGDDKKKKKKTTLLLIKHTAKCDLGMDPKQTTNQK